MVNRKVVATVLAVAATLTVGPAAARAQDSDGPADGKPAFLLFDAEGAGWIGAGLGVALVVIGGARGISRIGASAVESMARQPEAGGSINGATLVTAAMIEGAALFGVIVCLIIALKN